MREGGRQTGRKAAEKTSEHGVDFSPAKRGGVDFGLDFVGKTRDAVAPCVADFSGRKGVITERNRSLLDFLRGDLV